MSSFHALGFTHRNFLIFCSISTDSKGFERVVPIQLLFITKGQFCSTTQYHVQHIEFCAHITSFRMDLWDQVRLLLPETR